MFISVYCTKVFCAMWRPEPADLRALWGDPAACRAVVLVVDGEAAFINDNVEEVMGELLDSARALSRKTNRGDVFAIFAITKCDLIPESPTVAFGSRVRFCASAGHELVFHQLEGLVEGSSAQAPGTIQNASRVVSDNQLDLQFIQLCDGITRTQTCWALAQDAHH